MRRKNWTKLLAILGKNLPFHGWVEGKNYVPGSYGLWIWVSGLFYDDDLVLRSKKDYKMGLMM